MNAGEPDNSLFDYRTPLYAMFPSGPKPFGLITRKLSVTDHESFPSSLGLCGRQPRSRTDGIFTWLSRQIPSGKLAQKYERIAIS